MQPKNDEMKVQNVNLYVLVFGIRKWKFMYSYFHSKICFSSWVCCARIFFQFGSSQSPNSCYSELWAHSGSGCCFWIVGHCLSNLSMFSCFSPSFSHSPSFPLSLNELHFFSDVSPHRARRNEYDHVAIPANGVTISIDSVLRCFSI